MFNNNATQQVITNFNVSFAFDMPETVGHTVKFNKIKLCRKQDLPLKG